MRVAGVGPPTSRWTRRWWQKPERSKLNLSRIVEDRLREVVREERARRWLEENREGFEAFARFVEKNGIFNEDDREW